MFQETQESVREALESQPLEEQREYALGFDADGNKYIHFPQFCGQDLRVYRVEPVQMPKTERKPRKDDKKERVSIHEEHYTAKQQEHVLMMKPSVIHW